MGILSKFKKKNKDSNKKEDFKIEKNQKIIKEDKSEEKKKKENILIKKKDVKNKKEKNNAYKVLVKPLITEKVTDMGIYNKYAFEVAIDTNKQEVKKAIKGVYGVIPVSINIINMKGKKVRFGKTIGKTKKWKKAIITLKSSDKIEVYQGV